MKQDILRYLRQELPKHQLSAYYIPDGDVYVVHRKGRAIQNFNTRQFYEIPKLARNRMWNPLRSGLTHNLGERHKDQMLINTKMGIKIV